MILDHVPGDKLHLQKNQHTGMYDEQMQIRSTAEKERNISASQIIVVTNMTKQYL